MEGAQPPVEPLLVGCFSFFLHPLKEILTWFFSWNFFLLSNQRVHFLFFFYSLVVSKEEKNPRKKIIVKIFVEDEEKKSENGPLAGVQPGAEPPQ